MLMGGLNVDLLKYDHNTESASFLDSSYTNFLLPYNSTPPWVTTHSRALVDNSFSKTIENGLITPHKKHDSQTKRNNGHIQSWF